MPFPAFRKFCHFLAGFVVSLFSATSYAAKSTVCSTMSADAADPRLRIRASIHWSCRTRTPCPRSVCPPIRRIQAAAYAARTDGGCRTRSAARPASAAPDHTIRNRWWATRSSSDRQPCLAKPPSAHQPSHFSRNRHCSNECVAVIMPRGNRKIVMLFQYREFTAVGIRAADTLPQILPGSVFSSSKT